MTESAQWPSAAMRENWERVVALEEADRPRQQARMQKIVDAAHAPGFAGELRLAVLESGRYWPDLAATIGVEPQAVYDWMSGDDERLPASAISRLVNALELHLTAAR